MFRREPQSAMQQPPHAPETPSDSRRLIEAIERSQVCISFTPDATILDANENFLRVMGYRLEEIVGKKHSIFVDPVVSKSQGYQEFWQQLAAGTFQSGQFSQIAKGGRLVWIRAAYLPILDASGNVERITKIATDVTLQKAAELEIRDRTQGVIEFMPDGTIISANETFLSVVGYSFDEIKGQHHSMLMPEDETKTSGYADFWLSLAEGDHRQGQFRRIARGGQEVFLQGAYNPIFDGNGSVLRIVLGVADVTAEVAAKAKADAIGQQIAGNLAEMDAALGEISASVAGTAGLAQHAEADAHNATEVVHELNQSSESIGKVVTVIQRLSEQTNLLALNATIEAARAGESGRGFAVVANEVKVLSNQTGDATEDIRSSIEAIQSDISTVVGAIQGIVTGVAEVSSNTNTVAAAIEEQAVLMTQMNDTAHELLSVNRSA